MWESTYRQIRSHKYLFASLSAFNFPFGSISSFVQSRDHFIESLPPRHVVDILIRSYFVAVEPVYRLFHPQQFEDELNAFWVNNSQFSDEWLAQFFMVLTLGYQTTPGRLVSSISQLSNEWTDSFLDAVQFFFGRSPYVSSPTLVLVRTMCLVVIAQMLGVIKGVETPQLMNAMGFLSRSGRDASPSPKSIALLWIDSI